MKTKWNFLMALVLLATLVGGSAGVAKAQGGITGVSPEEGTVGTQVTITGAGFGDQHGEVLLGDEKSKVLDWSDTQITFLVDKPQHPDEYAITVLLPKKTAEPLTFEAFAIRRPQIVPGDLSLIRDGNTVTILGQFFGDKRGDLRVGYEVGGEMVVQDPKILDWSMSTIRFELPDGLTAGFVLAVRSEVGTGLAVMHLEGGVVGQVAPIPDWGGRESYENGNGVYYKSLSADDNFYIFSNNYNPGYSDNWRIGASILRPSPQGWYDVSISPPKGETEVPIQPLVVKDTAGKETLWVFHTGHMWADNACCTVVWYNKYYDNGIQGVWDSWKSVPNVGIDERVTVAPVYDPRNHRISVYYDWNNTLRWFYSDDFGATWSDDELVGKEVGGVPAIYSFVHAIYWPSDTTTALVASTGQVIAVNNGEYRGSIGDLTNDFWRPSLVDLGGQTGLIYQNYGEGEYYDTPMMTKLNYPTPENNETWSWSESVPLVTLPDTGIPLTSYSFEWSPRGAVNQVGNERHLYVFYGVHLAEAYTEESINRWYIHDEGILDPVAPLPEIKPTLFKQVTAGETHACAIKPDNTVKCWGNSNDGKLNPPAGTFSQISAGNFYTCGVMTDKSVACWGLNDLGQISERPTDKRYIQVAAGKQMACALTETNSVVCWGNDADGKTTPPSGYLFTQITAGSWHTCGLVKNPTTITVKCWGAADGGRTNDQTAPFVRISSAAWHNCGVTNTGTVLCWGDDDKDRASPPSGTFNEVSAGSWHTCGIKTDGSIACWGSDDDGRKSSMPTTGKFTHIEAGIRNTCALRDDGAIVCWGNNSDRQSLPPF